MATAVCDPLWGSTPIITLTASSSVAFDEAAVDTPDYGSLCGRTSFEPHLGEIPASQQLVRKPDGPADGRHIESQPARTPDATDQPRRREPAARPCVGGGEGPGAHASPEVHALPGHPGDICGSLPVAELADVVVACVARPIEPLPAEEDVARCLHEPLAGHEALPVVG